MDLLEIIKQLENLRQHCSEYVDIEDDDCVWARDCFALTKAIEYLLMIYKDNR